MGNHKFKLTTPLRYVKFHKRQIKMTKALQNEYTGVIYLSKGSQIQT